MEILETTIIEFTINGCTKCEALDSRWEKYLFTIMIGKLKCLLYKKHLTIFARK